MSKYEEVEEKRYQTELYLLEGIDKLLEQDARNNSGHVENLASAFALLYSGKPLGSVQLEGSK